MNLHDKQWLFMKNVAKLIEFIDKYGYTATFGEAFRTNEQAEIYAKNGKGIKNSLHCKRLAVDINLFRDGVYLSDTKDYKDMGEYWEKLDPLNVWGGRWNGRPDGNHFQMTD